MTDWLWSWPTRNPVGALNLARLFARDLVEQKQNTYLWEIGRQPAIG